MQTSPYRAYLPHDTSLEKDGDLTLCALTRESCVATLTALLTSDDMALQTIVAIDRRKDLSTFRIMYVFGHIPSRTTLIAYFDTNDTFPSLAGVKKQCAFYEREIATMFGLVPEGHPDPRPTMGHVSFDTETFPLRKDVVLNAPTEHPDPLSTYDFHTVAGEGVYEIPVGPVHAGIIEPGHFRFSVLGERIKKLDPMLGWKHKGIEKLFETLPLVQKVTLSERVSGDSSFAHSLAFCQALESLANIRPTEHARLLRVVFAELERMANHFSDIGFIMLDTAFTFGGANGSRLRERVMRWNERLTGSRFLRGVNMMGGVTVDISHKDRDALRAEVEALRKDFAEVIAVAEENLSLHDRLATTGDLTQEHVREYGVVGVPARATGIARDTRKDFPYSAYDILDFSVVTKDTADVYARFFVRVGEVYESLSLIEQVLARLVNTKGVKHTTVPHFRKNACAVGVVEGWRGEIVYVVLTDAEGVISRVKVRDPSFMNWQAFPETVIDEVVPDFPLINKSFNLSYSGNDL
ncbi:MAG: NADH-quinone oxidoreductase subunit C [Candidatus Pacebacteria bacterium]|nr:NADH-quinone oxidoreductase subunit C [Candidatus Paceibacterota bacterium]